MNPDKLTIRKAVTADIPDILRLLSQVLEIHADIRPDIFVHGTTKYSESDLEKIITDQKSPVYAAILDGRFAGYAFCEIKEMPQMEYFKPFRYIYIDDLCVDSELRGRNIGRRLFEFVKKEAEILGADEITLNVWEGNDKAKAFYDKLGFKPQKYTLELKVKDSED